MFVSRVRGHNGPTGGRPTERRQGVEYPPGACRHRQVKSPVTVRPQCALKVPSNAGASGQNERMRKRRRDKIKEKKFPLIPKKRKHTASV